MKFMAYLKLGVVLSFSANLCQASTCPSIEQIRNQELDGWQLLNIDTAGPAPASTQERFRKNVQTFALAEWMELAVDGGSHCYYFGQAKAPDYLGVYLSKRGLKPQVSRSWQKVSSSIQQCFADLSSCVFEPEST